MIQGVQDQGPQVDSGVKVDACSIEVGRKIWHVGAVERVPYATRSRNNRFEQFRSKEDDEEMSDDEDEGVVQIPHFESSSGESGDEGVEEYP
eukprot:1673907-Karenia_brevis.AAC.1